MPLLGAGAGRLPLEGAPRDSGAPPGVHPRCVGRGRPLSWAPSAHAVAGGYPQGSYARKEVSMKLIRARR